MGLREDIWAEEEARFKQQRDLEEQAWLEEQRGAGNWLPMGDAMAGPMADPTTPQPSYTPMPENPYENEARRLQNYGGDAQPYLEQTVETPMIDALPEQNKRLADLLKGSDTTGNWSVNEDGRRQLTMTGGKDNREFQSLGKYATPQEFLRADPVTFAKVNPNLVGQIKPESEDEALRARNRKEILQQMDTPVYGPDGRMDEAATFKRRQAIYDFFKNEETQKINQGKTLAETRRADAEARKERAPVRDPLDLIEAREEAKTKGAAERAKIAAKQPGTPEYNRIQAAGVKQTNARKSMDMFDRHAEAYIKNINDLIGDDEVDDKGSKSTKEHKGLQGAIGNIDSKLWDGLTFEEQVNARRLGEGLLNKASVKGLTEVREAGTAPGSITEKEWPIFQTQEEILAMSQTEGQYRKNLRAQRQLIREAQKRVKANWEEAQANFKGSDAAPADAAPTGGSGAAAQAIAMAQEALAKGKSKTAVAKMLQSMGVDPKGAGL